MTVHVPCLASFRRVPAMGTVSLRLERPIISLLKSDTSGRFSNRMTPAAGNRTDFFFIPF
jgi:hypothetical protein